MCYHRAMRAGDFEIRRLDRDTCSVVQYRGDAEDVAIPGVFGKYRAVSVEATLLRRGSKVRSISFPSSVSSIDEAAFSHMKEVRSISVEKGCRSYRSIDGVLYDGSGYSLVFYPPMKEDDELRLPDRLGKVEATAFACGTSVRVISLSQHLEEFHALPSQCPSLEAFVSPSSSGTGAWIADGVLMRGRKLLFYPPARSSSLYSIPEGIEEIVSSSSEPFFPESVKRIMVPKSLSAGLENALGNAESVDALPGNLHYRTVGDVLFSWQRKLLSYPGRKKDRLYAAPSGTDAIGRGAFRGARLETLVLPYGVKAIEDGAFEGSSISTLVVPETVDSIDIHALYGAGSLKEIHAVKGSVADIFFSGEGLGRLLHLSERLF